MNKTRFSPSAGTSYPFDIDYGDRLPGDIIEVDQAEYDAAVAARADGSTISCADGKLVITPPAPVSFAALSAGFMAEVRATREAILNRLAGIGMAALVNGDTAAAAAVRDARQALLDITKQPAVVAATTMDELRAAVKAAYKSITAAAPEAMRSAFNTVDA